MAYVLRTSAQQDIMSQVLSQEVDRLSQCRPGVTLVHLGPEHPQQRIASVKAARTCHCQVAEQRDPFPVREGGSRFLRIGCAEVQ